MLIFQTARDMISVLVSRMVSFSPFLPANPRQENRNAIKRLLDDLLDIISGSSARTCTRTRVCDKYPIRHALYVSIGS